MKNSPQRNRFKQTGVSLIETMVGLALGILVTLVITQVWGLFESQKQRSISGSAAQASGLLAMTELEQDIRSAGAGLNSSAAFECSTVYSYFDNGTTVVSPIPDYSSGTGMGLVVAPVQIVDGGSASNNADSISVKSGTDFLGALVAATITSSMPQPSAELNVSTTSGFTSGDIVYVYDVTSKNCTVMQLTQVQTSAGKLQHNPGGTPSYNPPVSFQKDILNNWPAYPQGSLLLRKNTPLSRSYTVSSSRELQLVDNTNPSAPLTSSLAFDIVSMKAQYGVASIGSQTVSSWVFANASSGWNVLNADKVKRIMAIRLVLVARSAVKEAANASFPCKSSQGVVTNPNGPCSWSDSEPVINHSANPDWQKYRYRVYQTIIPIRNTIWGG